MVTQRRVVPELMDDPALDPGEHDCALDGLARINRLSFAAAPIARAIKAWAGPRRSNIELLDVALGSADVTAAVASRLVAAGLGVRVTGVDISDHAGQRALARLRDAGVEAEFQRADVLRDTLPRADVVLCTLFLHHLSTRDVVSALRSLCDATTGLLVVIDLRRCRVGEVAAVCVPRVVTRSRVVHVDALRSARAALSEAELRECAAKADLSGSTVRRVFPFRMMLQWSPEADQPRVAQ